MRAADDLVVRLVFRDDPQEAESVDRFIEDGAWVSEVALVDAVWVLRRDHRLDPASVATAIEMLLQHKDLVLRCADAVAAALDLFRSRPSLGFAEAIRRAPATPARAVLSYSSVPRGGYRETPFHSRATD